MPSIPNASVPVRCPCGETIPISSETLDAHWVTIRNRDYTDVVRSEIRCRELFASGGNSTCCGPGHDAEQQLHDETWRIIERSGNLLTCTHCNRVLWMQPGAAGYSVFVPESVSPVIPGQ